MKNSKLIKTATVKKLNDTVDDYIFLKDILEKNNSVEGGTETRAITIYSINKKGICKYKDCKKEEFDYSHFSNLRIFLNSIGKTSEEYRESLSKVMFISSK